MSRQGIGVAKIQGFLILVNNTRPGDRVMIRITKVGKGFAAAEVFSQSINKDMKQDMGPYRRTDKKICQRTEEGISFSNDL